MAYLKGTDTSGKGVMLQENEVKSVFNLITTFSKKMLQATPKFAFCKSGKHFCKSRKHCC